MNMSILKYWNLKDEFLTKFEFHLKLKKLVRHMQEIVHWEEFITGI